MDQGFMAEKEWYHDSISRKESEAKLIESEKDGAFLVRQSDSVKGAYVLSLHMARFIHHYRIKLDTDGFFVTVNCKTNVNSMKFESLAAVIKYLIQNPNRIHMAGPLLYPIPPDVEEPDYEDDYSDYSDDEEDEEEQEDVINRCPADLRLSLKKRSSTYHASNQTMQVIQRVFNSLDTELLEESDPDFVALLRRYVESTRAFWDIQKGDTGGRGCLEQLIDFSCRELLEHLKLFNLKMEFLDQFVSGVAKASDLEPALSEVTPPVKEELLGTVDSALLECSGISKTIQSKISNVFKHISRSIQVKEECLINDTKTFEAKEGLRGKIQITVDPRRGTVSLGKAGTEFFHQQIRRLEKNYKDPTRMTILFDDRKKRDVFFEDTRVREEFYQTISQIKHIHKSDSEVKNISVFCCTWNMGEIEPTEDIFHLFDESGDHIKGFYNTANPKVAHDIYAIGSQEANITEKDWVNSIQKALSTRHPSFQYNYVGSQSLMGIRIVVLVKSNHINKISSVETSLVKTGVGGMVGNKGAVALSFTFGGTNIAFISCHLAARAERKLKRSQMYHDISRQLHLGKKSKLASFDLPFRFDHLFWLGDLNYRLDCEYEEVLSKTRGGDYIGLLRYDQLITEQTHGNVFRRFKEGEITFPPTYRYERGSRSKYVYEKIKTTGNVYNVPSYCDRVLLHSLPHLGQLQTGYFCNLLYKASDHAPVIATYQLDTKLQYVSSKNSETDAEWDDGLKIRFPTIQAKIKSNTPDRFYIKFFSSLLEGTPISKPAPRILADYNEDLMCYPTQHCLSKCAVSYWGSDDIPNLDPILRNKDYISKEYIFIQVLAHGSDECYGQGILTMRDKVIADSIQLFNVVLTLNDEICGEIRGKVCLSKTPVIEANYMFADLLENPDLAPNCARRVLPSPNSSESSSHISDRSFCWSNEYIDSNSRA